MPDRFTTASAAVREGTRRTAAPPEKGARVMSSPPQLPVGPPANVYLYVLPGTSGGPPSLLAYPRRKGDTAIFYTRPGMNPTPGRAREAMWVASGLVPGQILVIQEKASSAAKGV